MTRVQIEVPLSHLVPGRRNPRKVKPSREAHVRLVALIRSQGLLQPLVVRPAEDQPKHFAVIAGERRLVALRDIYRNDGNPKIPCILKDVDSDTADAVSLGENFAREPMHPLDEAEAFARLATREGKDAKTIADDFGVSEHYVRQRMRLADLSKVVKASYRAGEISTATAEAFASVPADKQIEVWNETQGHPRHAEHVRNVIANDWIDAARALFDLSALPPSAVSQDLFSERVLVERQTFMAAQGEALVAERTKLLDEGWKEVQSGRYEDLSDQVRTMEAAERDFDEPTREKLAKLAERKRKLEAKYDALSEDDEKGLEAVQEKMDAVAAEETEIEDKAPEFYSEATKSTATVFLMLLPDGQVRREYRVPRRRGNDVQNGSGNGGEGTNGSTPAPPTSNDLADRQLAATFTHQALAVREALLKSDAARKRVLVLLLNDRVRSEALAIRHDANGTTLHATSEGFSSSAFERIQTMRKKLDPFVDETYVDDLAGYERLVKLSASKLESLVDLLIVECLTAHMQRPTDLVMQLAAELKVNLREFWRPTVDWLSAFQKAQLSHLIVELKGSVHAPAPERKKSELVQLLDKLFADAAEGKLEDKSLAERVNGWLPSNLRETARESE